MAVSSPSAAALLDLPLEVLIDVCGHLDVHDRDLQALPP
jgi:hypothetical protein